MCIYLLLNVPLAFQIYFQPFVIQNANSNLLDVLSTVTNTDTSAFVPFQIYVFMHINNNRDKTYSKQLYANVLLTLKHFKLII